LATAARASFNRRCVFSAGGAFWAARRFGLGTLPYDYDDGRYDILFSSSHVTMTTRCIICERAPLAAPLCCGCQRVQAEVLMSSLHGT